MFTNIDILIKRNAIQQNKSKFYCACPSYYYLQTQLIQKLSHTIFTTKQTNGNIFCNFAEP